MLIRRLIPTTLFLSKYSFPPQMASTKKSVLKTTSFESPSSLHVISQMSSNTTAINSPIPISSIAKLSQIEPQWCDMNVAPEELRITVSLATGQCFNWRPVSFRQDKIPIHQSIKNSVVKKEANEEEEILNVMNCFEEKNIMSWVGVLEHYVIALKETPTTTLFACLNKDTVLSRKQMNDQTLQKLNNDEEDELNKTILNLLKDYFQLNIPLQPLYQEWSQKDNRIKVVAECLPGLRILKQDPAECLISFIVSSNNNIGRIRLILDRIRSEYGDHLLTLSCINGSISSIKNEIRDESISPKKMKKKQRRDSNGMTMLKEEEEESGAMGVPLKRKMNQTSLKASGDQSFYSFPPIAKLALLDEATLRSFGLGYRARFIKETSEAIVKKENNFLTRHENHGEDISSNDWLSSLRNSEKFSREYVQNELKEFVGVGQKVADCVALFSMDRHDIIPVDTHVWQIACRDFDPSLRHEKSLTPAVYNRVGDLFRNHYGVFSGWAHSLLFAELPSFSKLLPLEMQNEMGSFKKDEKERKSQKKNEKDRQKMKSSKIEG